MFRTISARALGLCLRSGHPFQSIEASASVYSAHHQLSLPTSFSSVPSSLRVGLSSRPSFPTAASNISCRLFHGGRFPLSSSSAGRTLNRNDDDDDFEDDLANDDFIDMDGPMDFGKDRGRTSSSVGGRTPNSNSHIRGSRGAIDEDESMGLNRRQPDFDDEDWLDNDRRGAGDAIPRQHRRQRTFDDGDESPVLTESLTTLLTTLRSQATTHNEELKMSRSEHAATDVTFDDFGLESTLVARLKELDYDTPFEIQAKTMKALMEGKNVVGQAVTGAGKTLAFGIPLVNALIKGREERQKRRPSSQPKALILTPTRELCNQITNAISELDRKVKCLALYGGRSITSDQSNLQRGVDVVCATPGRLRDLIRRRSISLDKLEFLVLDEADEMLKDAWIADLEDILEGSPPEKQAILFSATMPPEIYEVAENFLQRQLEVIRVKDEESDDNAPSAVNHLSLYTPARDQTRVVKELISFYKPKSTIVFVPTRDGTSRVADEIRRKGIRDVQVLQGGMSQSHRDRVLDGFRNDRFSVLVATDVAARGLDIPNVELIVQIGLPQGLPAYLHRSGRTGRAGKSGLAVLVHSATKQELDFVRDLKRKVKNLQEEDIGQRPAFSSSRDSSGSRGYSYGQRGGFDRGGGGRGGNFQRRDGGYGGGGNFRQRDQGDYGYGRSGGGRGGIGGYQRRQLNYDEDNDDFVFDRQGGGRGGNYGGGRGGHGGGDRRPRRNNNDYDEDLWDKDDDDDFGNERRSRLLQRGGNDKRVQDRSWTQDEDLDHDFKSFLSKRHSSVDTSGQRRNDKKDDDDFW